MAERRSKRGIRVSADTRVMELASEEWGVLSLDELRACGLSRDGVLRRANAGHFRRLYPAVYAIGHVSEAPEQAWMAAVKACGPNAVLACRSAGEAWEFLEDDPDSHLPQVIAPGNRSVPGIWIRRSRLDAHDAMRHRGIPITTPARTLVDLAAILSETGLRPAVRRAQGVRRVSVPLLLRTLDRLGPRRGTKMLRRVIATGPAPTRSVLENVVLDLLLGAGFEHPDVNKPIVVDGRRVIPDFRWPRTAPDRRGRRRCLARPCARRRAPGAARGARRAGASRQLEAGDAASSGHGRAVEWAGAPRAADQ
jgi:hypothetical protein